MFNIYIYPGVDRIWFFPKLLTEMGISLNLPYHILLQDDDVSPAPSGPKPAGT